MVAIFRMCLASHLLTTAWPLQFLFLLPHSTQSSCHRINIFSFVLWGLSVRTVRVLPKYAGEPCCWAMYYSWAWRYPGGERQAMTVILSSERMWLKITKLLMEWWIHWTFVRNMLEWLGKDLKTPLNAHLFADNEMYVDPKKWMFTKHTKKYSRSESVQYQHSHDFLNTRFRFTKGSFTWSSILSFPHEWWPWGSFASRLKLRWSFV